MPRYRTFSIRMTEEEHRHASIKAQARGMNLGQYMRFRTLAPESHSDVKVVAAYNLLKDIVERTDG